MKPFCSGGRADVRLLRAMQDGELAEDEINPFYFPEPIAPLISARQHKRAIPLAEVIERIQQIAARCECLVIEGSGGLLVPLGTDSQKALSHIELLKREYGASLLPLRHAVGERAGERWRKGTRGEAFPYAIHGKEAQGEQEAKLLLHNGIPGDHYFVSDLIQRLHADVILVSRNRLGTINHTLLTLKVLRDLGVNNIQIALVDQAKKDPSSVSNHRTLKVSYAPRRQF